MTDVLALVAAVVSIVAAASTAVASIRRRRRAMRRMAAAVSREILDAATTFVGAASTAFARALAVARARAATIIPHEKTLDLAMDLPTDSGAVAETRARIRQLQLHSLDDAADEVLERLVEAGDLVGQPWRRLRRQDWNSVYDAFGDAVRHLEFIARQEASAALRRGRRRHGVDRGRAPSARFVRGSTWEGSSARTQVTGDRRATTAPA